MERSAPGMTDPDIVRLLTRIYALRTGYALSPPCLNFAPAQPRITPSDLRPANKNTSCTVERVAMTDTARLPGNGD